MALTILSQPGSYCSVTNDMLFIINEATKANDPVNYPDYKYILDVFYDGNRIARLKAYPDPVNKFGIFDLSPIIRNLINIEVPYGLKLSSISEKVDYYNRISYSLELGEEYSFVEYGGLITTGSYYAYRTFAKKPFTSSSLISGDYGLASNMPSVINSFGDPVLYNLIPYFSNVTGAPVLDVSFRDAAGSVVGGYSVVNTDMYQYGIRQINIDNTATGAAYALLTGPFNVRINYQCSKYTVNTLAWLNQYGAYESQNFGMVSKKNIEVSKKTFEQIPYRINASGEVSYLSDEVFYGGKREYNRVVKTRLSLISHLLSDGEYTWLADLFMSPDVYLYTSQGWVPVSVVNNNYEYRNYGNSRLVPLQFDIEFSEDFNSQFL